MTVDYEKLSDRELDALVAERVMGISLIPPREKAMVQVGWRYISCTGKSFSLTTREDLPMPEGALLPQPEGTEDWNARYALFVAKHLGDKIKAEVDAVREPAQPYSTDDNAVRLVRDRIAELGLQSKFTNWLVDVTGDDFNPAFMDFRLLQATPRQQCVAALRALDAQQPAEQREGNK